ncbi:MAG TPA: helix-turn-helix domain-containing protein, partial [Sedimentisphaerales bacterium]|nr:helix-turn-helix domain-containing protein [Sedimentisphaerales bacterium]
SPGNTLTASILPPEILANVPAKGSRKSSSDRAALEVEIRTLIERFYTTAEESAGAREQLHASIERTIIARALAEGMSQRTLAAKLGLSRTTLRKRIADYGIEGAGPG